MLIIQRQAKATVGTSREIIVVVVSCLVDQRWWLLVWLEPQPILSKIICLAVVVLVLVLDMVMVVVVVDVVGRYSPSPTYCSPICLSFICLSFVLSIPNGTRDRIHFTTILVLYTPPPTCTYNSLLHRQSFNKQTDGVGLKGVVTILKADAAGKICTL